MGSWSFMRSVFIKADLFINNSWNDVMFGFDHQTPCSENQAVGSTWRFFCTVSVERQLYSYERNQ